MKSEWKPIKVGELGRIITGKTPSTKVSEYWGGKIPFITPKDLQGTKHIIQTERYVTDVGVDNVRGCKIPANAVCVSCIGNIGYVGMTIQNSISNQQINSIITNDSYESNFIYYLMKNLWSFFKNYEGQSTTLSILNKKQFSKIDINVPNIVTQKRIAYFLSLFDDKIELNNKINENLSEMLQTYYRDKFYNLKYHESCGRLDDICEYSKDKVLVSNISLSNYYSTENMLPEKAGAVEASNLPTAQKTTKCKAGDVLISNIRPYFKKIAYCSSEGGCSADVLCFVPKRKELSAYLYSTLYDDSFFRFMVSGSKGTKMPRGDKKQIMTYGVYIPTDKEIEIFNTIAVPVLNKIESAHQENIYLSSLRDVLLPRLMSGELDVSEIDI